MTLDRPARPGSTAPSASHRLTSGVGDHRAAAPTRPRGIELQTARPVDPAPGELLDEALELTAQRSEGTIRT